MSRKILSSCHLGGQLDGMTRSYLVSLAAANPHGGVRGAHGTAADEGNSPEFSTAEIVFEFAITNIDLTILRSPPPHFAAGSQTRRRKQYITRRRAA